MSRASIPTLLALDRAAAILGIAPPHFNQGVSDVVFPLDNSCGNIVYQHPWQNADASSREDFAREIATAEEEIANYLGWWPAPTWIAQDVRMYPRPYRPDTYDVGGWNVRWQRKGLKARYGKIIEPGQRKVAFICTACKEGHELCEEDCELAYSDADDDDFSETATVTAGTTLTDECEIKVYFHGHYGEPEWEIRPARTKTIGAGVFTATFYSWQLIDPAYWEAFPTAATPNPAVDLDEDVYVDCVDVYREYNDPTATSAVFYWEPEPSSLAEWCDSCGGSGCVRCTLTEQNGCAHIRDAELGTLAPAPGAYDGEEAAWESASWSVCRDPDQVKLYYYCGDLSWLNLAGRRGDDLARRWCDGLSEPWARIITYLATARLRRPLCACGTAGALVDWLQVDLARISREESHVILWELTDNPFGTRRGEVEAWKYVRDLVRNSQAGAGAVI